MSWETLTLGELAERASGEVRTGPFGSQLHKADYVDDPAATPVVMPKDMIDGKIATSSIARVDDPVLERLRAHRLGSGDIVLGRRGDIGRRAWVGPMEEGWLCGTGSMRVSLNGSQQVRPRFVFYYLALPGTIAWLEGHAVGATMSNLSAGVVEQLPVQFPSLQHQDEIIRVLDSIEHLIENNRRRIEILEEMARLLYREWFVHFRFPGHENVELVDSELGPIPEGWERAAVSEIAEVVRGRSYRKAELVADGGLPFLNLKCIDRGGGFRKSGLKRYDGKYKSVQETYAGDIVVAVTDMTQQRMIVGQAGRVPVLDSPFGIISLDLARVVPNEGVDREYLYGHFRYSTFSRKVKEFANGTNVLHLSPDRIKEHEFALAPVPLRDEYGDRVRPLYELADNLGRQIDVLREARDLLLPRLVSGELDVSELDLDGVLA